MSSRSRVIAAWGLFFVASSVWHRMSTSIGPMTIVVGVPCLCLAVECILCTARAHSFISRLLRSLLRIGMVASFGAFVWAIVWSDRRPWNWIDPRTNWEVPLIGSCFFALLLLFTATLNSNPRRVRGLAYPDRLEPMGCPRCRKRMRLAHRHAECDACHLSQLLPRRWWVCECGQPLRGVLGDHCPECGGGPSSYALFTDADLARRPKPRGGEWTLDDIIDREG